MFNRIAEKRVATGAAFLDVNLPGWHNRIDLKRLDIGWPNMCVLGQLYGRENKSFEIGARDLDLSQRMLGRMGFAQSIFVPGPNFKTLKKYWVRQIETRRQADSFYAELPLRDDDPVHV